mmetsp:Transcript_25714/g.67999  ORF Transcript_25714/g.67999 Transcript_25714/m.67999 type:complete len:410 (-) Transcript_25714:187-1416(-)
MMLLACAMPSGLVVSSRPAGLQMGTQIVPAVSMQASTPANLDASDLDALKAENAALLEQLAATEMSSRSARLVLPVVGLAALGSLAIIPPGSSPIAEAVQEMISESSRKTKVDPRAEAAMATYFPGALGSLTTDRIVSSVLSKRGYTKDNTLFATSTCPDEVNSKPGELIDILKNRFGENFALGGLAGVPFTGRAGFAAYAHHAPRGGRMFILFAPHVGVEYDGLVGALRRANQDEVSTACGAAVGAFKALMKEKDASGAYEMPDGVSDYFDAQINFIKLKLASRIKEVSSAPDANAFVAYQMYTLVREFFVNELLTSPGFWDCATEVTVLGGIQINRGVGGDRFMPLMLQSCTKEEESVVDLYEEAFGPPPVDKIRDVLGTSNADVFNYRLDTYQLSDKRIAVSTANI